MANKPEAEIKPFKSALAWEQWLSKNHNTKPGVWLKIAKKDSGILTVTYDQALDVALCYGWIDGQKKTFDEKYFLQKFTPRRRNSLWSKRNVTKALELIAASKMRPAGLAEVKAAQADGRFQVAYDSPKNMKVPADFMRAVGENEKAKDNFTKLNKASLYSIAWRLQTAKTSETRKRRFEDLIQKLKKGQKI